MNDEDQKNIFSSNLRKYVSQSGKMQKDIANDLKVPIQTFNGWCNGISIPSMGKVQKIADYFRIGKSDLLENTSQVVPSITQHEYEYVQKIRQLDRFGIIAVMDTIEREFLRCQEQTMEKATANMYDYIIDTDNNTLVIENKKFVTNRKKRSPYNHEE